MKLDAAPGGEFVVIGENMHTTRAVMRRGARFAADAAEGGPAVRYADSGGAERLLPVPEWAARTQDFEEGRVKHIMIAVRGAMEGDAECERYLRAVVAAQEAAGADFLDVNVDEISVKFAEQTAAMAWLVRFVQAASRLPVSVDSSNVDIIAAGLAACAEGGPRPLLNSASLERMDALDLALRRGAEVVVTAAGDSGMPDGADQRIDNASRMVEAARARGFADSDIYIDPLYFPISVDGAFGAHALDAIRGLRARFGGGVRVTGGFSNVSFGIPARKTINDVFTIMAVEAGADSGIVNPVASPPPEVFAMDRESELYRLAEDVLTGRDEHCKAWIRAWRLRRRGARRPARV